MTNEQALMKVNGGVPAAGTSYQQTGTGMEISRGAELATSAIEEQARAIVQARFFLAHKQRRIWDDVEQRLFRECARPRFAATAMYSKPVGGTKVTGLSIRFAEAALRVAGNIDVQAQEIFDDLNRRVMRVTAMDLETNFAITKDVLIEKIVERRQPDDKREVIYVRQNSNGQTVYGVRATDDEVLVKQNALISKEIRNLGLRLIPGDILDECKAIIMRTVATRDAADPESARKEVLDAFAGIGVMPSQIAEYLEHGTDSITVSELADLRGIYSAIKNNEASWRDVMAAKTAAAGGDEKKPNPGAEKVKARIEKARAKSAPAPATEPAAPDAYANLKNLETFPHAESCDADEVVRVQGKLYKFNVETGEFKPL